MRGWVRLTSYTEPRDALLAYSNCFLRRAEGGGDGGGDGGSDGGSDEWVAARIEASHPQGKSLVGKLAGVEDRDAAIAWRGADIGLPREQLPTAGYGHYYWADLEGLTVRHRDGRELGKVAYLLATGQHDVLVVQGEREVLIPFVMDKFILAVDLANGLIDVDWEWD